MMTSYIKEAKKKIEVVFLIFYSYYFDIKSDYKHPIVFVLFPPINFLV